MNSRLQYLDGLRGLAILMVLSFHAFSRWPDLVPYGDQYSDIIFFKGGWLGVQLFFLISGFVILMSLDKCSSIRGFLYKRWIRLFPAMLVCSILVFVTSEVLYERPAGAPKLLYLIPGLTFIEPSWWSKLLGFKVEVIEGAFWSLFVEFKFYVTASFLYFSVGSKKLVFSLLFLFLCAILLKVSVIYSNNQLVTFLNEIIQALSFRQFGWFAAGSAFYIFHKKQKKEWFFLGILISIMSAATVTEDNSLFPIFGAMIISTIFALSLVSVKMQSILESRVLCYFGFISYPLYLIHENAMISMIIKLGHLFPGIPGYLYPIIPVIILIGIAYLVVKYAEPFVKKGIVTMISNPILKRI